MESEDTTVLKTVATVRGVRVQIPPSALGEIMAKTDDEVLNIAKQSYSISDMLTKLGLRFTGANHANYTARLKKLGFDRSTFLKRPFITSPKIKLTIEKFEKLLIKGDRIGTSEYRRSLIKFGFLENQCTICNGNPVWQGKPLRMHLDHIDGDRYNNVLTNLRILCPNCHSQTETYGALKEKPPSDTQKRVKLRINTTKRTYSSVSKIDCKTCGIPLLLRNKTGYCIKHYVRPQCYKPPPAELLSEIEASNYSAVSRKYGVSPNSIKKWARRLRAQTSPVSPTRQIT